MARVTRLDANESRFDASKQRNTSHRRSFRRKTACPASFNPVHLKNALCDIQPDHLDRHLRLLVVRHKSIADQRVPWKAGLSIPSLMQDRSARSTILLRRTAGPYIWVRTSPAWRHAATGKHLDLLPDLRNAAHGAKCQIRTHAAQQLPHTGRRIAMRAGPQGKRTSRMIGMERLCAALSWITPTKPTSDSQHEEHQQSALLA